MLKSIAVTFALLTAALANAQEQPKIMLFGTFHFENPGRDVVKVSDVNVLDADSQRYLERLVEQLAQFKPTKVLLEYNPASEDIINGRYEDYLKGEYELEANEVYQLGFRLAKATGLPRVYSFDHREVHWQAEKLFAYAKENESPQMDTFNQLIAEVTESEEQARATMTLGELLMRTNNPEGDRINMDLYLATNAIGAGDGFVGADASASWWRRNFRMYANIQRLAQPGDRVVVIGGQGHTAILRQLLSIDRRLDAVSVTPYLN